MKASDKVYIDDLAVVNDCSTKISFKPLPNFSEYIRKDVLLEFLTSLEKDSTRNVGTDDLAYAAHEMVCMLIDKIESL